MNRSVIQLVYITVPDEEEASRIADAAVEARLAACANIIPGMNSVFPWQGAVQKEKETILILKTRRELEAELTDLIKKNHSYTVPCILSVEAAGLNQDYTDWLYQNLKTPE